MSQRTKRSPRSRAFSITYNNPPDGFSAESYFDECIDSGAIYAVGQLERGEQGTLHLQAAVVYKHPRSSDAVRIVHQGMCPGCHVEPARNMENIIRYVQKAESRVDGPWESGENPVVGAGHRSDLLYIREMAAAGKTPFEISEEYPSAPDRARHLVSCSNKYFFRNQAYATYKKFISGELKKKVRYYYGPTRGGKTRRVLAKYVDNLDDLFILRRTGKTTWFDGYSGQKAILLDDYLGWLSADVFLALTDIYPLHVQIKGDFTYVNFETVYITSNLHPTMLHAKLQDMDTLAAVRARIDHQSEVIDAKSIEIRPESPRPRADTPRPYTEVGALWDV